MSRATVNYTPSSPTDRLKRGAKRAGSIPAMCQEIIDIEAESRADYEQTIKKQPARRVPVAIASSALKHPDFDALDAKTRGCRYGGAIPTWVIEGAINSVQKRGMVEKAREGDVTVLRVHDKPLPPNKQNAAQIGRLQRRLKIARAFAVKEPDVHAMERAWERRGEKRSVRAYALELQIIRLRSKTPADLIAKTAVYEIDHERFTDEPPTGGSLVESIMRDIPATPTSPAAAGP
jgi:hypothetical protein